VSQRKPTFAQNVTTLVLWTTPQCTTKTNTPRQVSTCYSRSVVSCLLGDSQKHSALVLPDIQEKLQNPNASELGETHMP